MNPDILSMEVLTDFSSVRARSLLAEADALITGWGSPRIDKSVLDLAPRLRLIAHAAGTVKGHVSPACWDRGITVTTAAGANAVPVAEYTLAFILLAGKKTFAEIRSFQNQQNAYQGDNLNPGTGNHGSTVGIIGASRVGRVLLEMLRPFGMRVLLSDPTITQAEAASLGATLTPLENLMARSDVISLHLPALASTRGMIGASQLRAMRDGATFINTSRGTLVDHGALRRELQSGRISAVLDVTDPEPLPDGDPLYGLPNVILTPHLAGSMGNELARLGSCAVAEVERFAAGLPPADAVLVDELTIQA
jgi:phosphoglycerate dehydrogenase-like enzyme